MRYRDLETGTFLTRDPIGYADGPNVYCYVNCNPITRFDPLGLEFSNADSSSGIPYFYGGGFFAHGWNSLVDVANNVIDVAAPRPQDTKLGCDMMYQGMHGKDLSLSDRVKLTSLGLFTAAMGVMDVVDYIPDLSDAMQKEAREAGVEILNRQAKDGAGELGQKSASQTSSQAAQLRQNAAQGKKFEGEVKSQLGVTQENLVEQITVKTESGVKTRLDFAGTDVDTGLPKLTEAKSSATAPLTGNQKAAFPEIKESGATVVGKGKEPFTGGTEIPPTEVEIVRP